MAGEAGTLGVPPPPKMNKIKVMLSGLAWWAVLGAHAQPTRSNEPAPAVQVYVQSEARDLARGYAKAFASLSKAPISLVARKDGGGTRVFEDVRSVRDVEGVLLVEVGRGLLYIINANEVLYVTDGPLLK